MIRAAAVRRRSEVPRWPALDEAAFGGLDLADGSCIQTGRRRFGAHR